MLHSQHLNGALVYYDNTRQRWLDAIGNNVIKYLQHFAQLPTDDTTGDPTEWTVTVVETGAGDSTAVLGTEADGVLLITTDAAENDGVNMQLKGAAFDLGAGNKVYFGARLKLSDVTQSDLLIGLCITDTTLLGGMTDGIYFRKVDGAATLAFVLEKDSNETSGNVATLVNDTYVILEFVFDGTNVDAFVDGVAQTRLAVTNLPNDEVLTPSLHFLTGEAVAKTCKVDWLRVIQLSA